MLNSKERNNQTKTKAETNRLEMQYKSLDRQIDEAADKLDGLTEKEISIEALSFPHVLRGNPELKNITDLDAR